MSKKARRQSSLALKTGPAQPDRSPGRRLVYCLCAVMALCPVSAAAQVDQQVPPPLSPSPRTNNTPDRDTTTRKIIERMARQRNTERQKKIVADTAKLLAMAQKLNDEVSHSSKNQLSIAVVQQAAEIEKLAKSIKEKMRDGY